MSKMKNYNFMIALVRRMLNRTGRHRIMHLFRFLPDKFVVTAEYLFWLSRLPNLRFPRRFTEKLTWYKLYYHDPLMTQCADKYEVREFIKSKGLSEILNELYFVFDSVDSIDYESLPKQFVMKTTNYSGTNIICPDKTKLTKDVIIRQMRDYWYWGKVNIMRDWAYKNIKNRIIVERYMIDPTQKDNSINDYKFFCFNGCVKYMCVDVGRYDRHLRTFFDRDGHYIRIDTDHPSAEPGEIILPGNIVKMQKIAEKLSIDFPFVRVDLYSIEESVIFGEMTFYPWSGTVQFTPDRFDYELGEHFVLPAPKNARS